jgi:hypothetical protein
MSTDIRTPWTKVEGNHLNVGVEFAKVNKAKRLVSGWATLDNEDTQGDIVTAEASAKAFARARGNLREMHKKDSAVGRIVNFKEAKFTDRNGQTYNGIFVTARVSEGAQDTWLKVLDGTLSGFSIGGAVNESEEIFKKSGEKIQKVTDYDLQELSLVDNPANPLSNVERVEKNVFSIHTDENGIVKSITGMAAEQDILNVFYCEADEIALAKSLDGYACPMCNEVMKNIDYIEGGKDTDEKVRKVIAKFVAQDEGGETMSRFSRLVKSATVQEGDDESVATGHEQGDPQEIPTPARTEQDEVVEVDPEAADENEDVNEVHDDEAEIAKKIDGLKSSIEEILKNSRLETNEKIKALEKAVGDTRELLEKKISELGEKYESISEDLNITKSRQIEMQNSISKMNSSGAFRKSVDVDDSTVTEQQSSIWQGSALDPRSALSQVDRLVG